MTTAEKAKLKDTLVALIKTSHKSLSEKKPLCHIKVDFYTQRKDNVLSYGYIFGNTYISTASDTNLSHDEVLGMVKWALSVVKATKGYKDLSYTIQEQDGFWEFSFTLLMKPCRAYEKLIKRLRNADARDNNGLPLLNSDMDLFRVDLFGKRGAYNEHGPKVFAMHYPEWCNEVSTWIVKNYRKGMALAGEVDSDDWMDNLQESIRLETECYGVRHTILQLTATTPKGKEKKKTFIF